MPTINNEKNMVIHSPDEIELCFKVDGCSMVIKDNVPFEFWQKKFSQLRELNGVLLWFLGDMILYAEKNYGERCYQEFDQFDYDACTLKNAAWVASKFDPARRRAKLSWSHHLEAASLDSKKADKWLEISEREKYSSRDLRKALKTEDGSKVLEVPSVKLLTLFTSLKEKAEEIFKSMPIDKWDDELLEKMKETFYGTVYDIEAITGWERNDTKREFKVKGKTKRAFSA